MSSPSRPVCSACGQPIERHAGTGTGWRHVANAPEWCTVKPPRPAPPARPFCRHCGKPVHEQARKSYAGEAEGEPETVLVHSGSLRVRCADNRHDAER